MMIKYRVHEVAKDLNVPSKDVITLLGEHFDTPKKHMTALTEDELNVVFEHYTKKEAVESFDAYFASGEQKKEAPAQIPEQAPVEAPAPEEAPAASAPEKTPAAPAPAPVQGGQNHPVQGGQNRPVQGGQNRPVQGGQNRPVQGGQNRPVQGGQNRPVQGGQNRPMQGGQNRPAQGGQNRPMQGGQNRPVQGGQSRPVQQPAAQNGPVSNKPELRGSRHVDMRAANVELDKYNERYENIAPTNMVVAKDNGVKKQKLTQRSAQKGRPQFSRKDKEAQKMRKLEMERQRRQKLEITIPDEITVGELALRLKVQAAEIIKKLMLNGVMAAQNDVIDYDTAALVAMDIGAKVEREVVVTIEDRLIDDHEDENGELQERSPVVVVMGHVDHGKTSLLDAIRHTNVTAAEAGGITQHIGAYRVMVNGKPITFLDTPGHAAFTSMRARGAQVTDIAILVVAADDGIMPQTVEAINHAKAAGVSIIVAINKMDKPDANADKVKQELTEYELVPEEWGGDVICVPVSAKTNENIDTLLEMVQLVADMKELKANPDRQAKGVVIEAKLDRGRGPVATVLVQNGTLRTGDVIIAGTAVGRVRVMTNDRGEQVEEAGPSVPVEITGLAEVPDAGDILNAVEDEKLARELVEQRRHEMKEEQFSAYQKVTLDNLFSQIAEGEMKELPIIVKADVMGSVEAVKQSLEKISNDEVRVKVIHGAVGAVSESDVMLASASGAIIVGFNVRPEPLAKEAADRDGVEIRLYRIIYDAIEDVTTAMKGMLSPKFRDVDLGRAEVRAVYKITGVGTVAGGYVLEGKIARSANIRVVRDGIIVADDKLSSLKRFKDDVKEVAQGYECGMSLEKFSDIKEGDVFEAYIVEEYHED
ncbi:MAG: translation initiation factor IF-2 [Oscillospiraceae bacterium]|nr:translation initiation factor IF-2 [Oscillospiraceae bacterium]